MPSMPGMRTSVTTQPASRLASSFRKACAGSKSRTLKPAEPSRKSSESRIAGSSSMTSTLALGGIGHLLGGRNGQREAEGRTTGPVGFGPHPAAVGFDDGAADRKTDAHAGLLRREKWLEQVRERIACEAWSGVGNGN